MNFMHIQYQSLYGFKLKKTNQTNNHKPKKPKQKHTQNPLYCFKQSRKLLSPLPPPKATSIEVKLRSYI